MNNAKEILTASYWAHFKAAKDAAMIYDLKHPYRIKLETALEEIRQELAKLHVTI